MHSSQQNISQTIRLSRAFCRQTARRAAQTTQKIRRRRSTRQQVHKILRQPPVAAEVIASGGPDLDRRGLVECIVVMADDAGIEKRLKLWIHTISAVKLLTILIS